MSVQSTTATGSGSLDTSSPTNGYGFVPKYRRLSSGSRSFSRIPRVANNDFAITPMVGAGANTNTTDTTQTQTSEPAAEQHTEIFPGMPTPESILSDKTFPTESLICGRVTAFCIVLILTGSLSIICRKIQIQTEHHPQSSSHLYFQWITVWLFFLSRASLLLLVCCRPFYNQTRGISSTFHSEMTMTTEWPLRGKNPFLRSRHERFKSQCLRQVMHCTMAFCLVTAHFLMNVALYYMTASLWILFFCVIVLYLTFFKFFVVKPSIVVFLGVFFVFISMIILVDVTIHQTQLDGSRIKATHSCLAIFCMIPGLLFLTIYHLIYQHLYSKHKKWMELLVTLKTLRKSKLEKMEIMGFGLRFKYGRPVFEEWNHTKFLYMEGIYGLIITSMIIALLDTLHHDPVTPHGYWPRMWTANVMQYIKMLKGSSVQIAMTICYVIAEIGWAIFMELSKSYLTHTHSKGIYLCTVIVVWVTQTVLYFASKDWDIRYGERPNLNYWLMEGAALLLVSMALMMYDERYVIYINGFLEHNGTILKQHKLRALSKYWSDIYIRKEKERLNGFSPKYLNGLNPKTLGMDEFESSVTTSQYTVPRDDFDIDEVQEESSFNYHELSVNSAKRDGTQLEGTLNLLLGSDVHKALVRGPSKYYPSYYK